jgi:hypothetical protein
MPANRETCAVPVRRPSFFTVFPELVKGLTPILPGPRARPGRRRHVYFHPILSPGVKPDAALNRPPVFFQSVAALAGPDTAFTRSNIFFRTVGSLMR